MQKIFRAITRYLSMIVLALGLFGIIIWISGKNPIVSYRELFGSTLGSWYGFSEVLVAMTPMLITALAVALPSRIGLINVGVEGQLYMGACAATWGALIFSNAPAWILLPVMAIFGMLGGALWALIPGLLRAMGLVNETITTLLLNSVAPKIVAFFVFGFWHSPMDTNKTPKFVDAARLPTFDNRDLSSDRFLAGHEAHTLGVGNAGHRWKPRSGAAKWCTTEGVHRGNPLHRRCDRWSCWHGPGFRVLRCAADRFLTWSRLRRLPDQLAFIW
jgi:ABC-type uncharacterized transport system permease subunit